MTTINYPDMPNIGVRESIYTAKRMIAELVYNMARLEGNTLSFAETQTVVDGISISGKPMRELHQVEHIRDGWLHVIKLVKDDKFDLSKSTFIEVNAIVAEDENLSPGAFRETHVKISGTDYMPPMPMLLPDLFRAMIEPHQHPYDVFLDTARNQYFEDGNKRTGQLMMNGILMRDGFAPISISDKDRVEYIEKLIRFYVTNEKQGMIDFLAGQQKRYAPEINIDPPSRGRGR